MTGKRSRRTFTVPVDAVGERLDRWLAAQPRAGTRSQVERAIETGQVHLNGRPTKPSRRLRGGETVVVEPPTEEDPLAYIEGEPLPLEVLYQDELLIVVNKAPGMVVHPAVGHRSGTLVHALLYHFPGARWPGGVERAGIVHRLDRDTSGVLLVARTVEAHEALARQFRRRTIGKEYLALVWGDVCEEGRIEDPIGRHPRDRKRMSVVARRSRSAMTEYEPLERFGAATLLLVRLHTGRTHQIRVHLAARGWPVVADPVYGRGGRRRERGLRDARSRVLMTMPRQALHAWRIHFTHPGTGAAMDVEAPLPADLGRVLTELRASLNC